MRILLVLISLFLYPPLVIYSKLRKLPNLPKPFYIFDNEEDGYDGDKRGWYKEYHRTRNTFIYNNYDNLLISIYVAIKWCIRNPVWNMRMHPKFSIPVNKKDISNMTYSGNTAAHEYYQSFEGKRQKIWYDITFVVDGKLRKSKFRRIPLWGSTSFYIRTGWKIYPHHYVKQNGELRKDKREIPLYNRRSIKVYRYWFDTDRNRP